MIDTYEIYEELKEASDEKLAKVLTKKLTQIYREVSDSVTKKEFNELKKVVKELSEKVKSLSENLEQFQKETEKNFKRIWQSIDELKEAQKKTEEKLNQLAEAQKRTEDRLNQLAEAQRRTEDRLNQLTEAQKKTEDRLNQLAEAQRKTEDKLNKLIGEVKKIKEQLGGLSHTVGYFLEDRAYISLPKLLRKDYNLEVIEPLKRDFIKISSNRYIEVNIIGKGKKENREYIILGECKTQLKKKDVDNFIKTISKIKNIFNLPIFPVLITFQTSPQVKKYLESKNLSLYYSYQLSNSLI